MPYLSGNTKKVSVYGRKAEVRVVNRQSTFTSLDNDENDPFGFFKTQTKPKATYGKSRAPMLPSKLYSKSAESDSDDSVDDLSATDRSQAYDTANSSLSFHSACSSESASSSSKTQARKASAKSSPRKPLVSKALNDKAQLEAESVAPSKAKKALTKVADSNSLDATPKASRTLSRKNGVESLKTVRKSGAAKASSSTLPNESTPPLTQPIGRASRRAAQAARMAIEDYDFTDRDMTPRRPVPTKSYFVEKARQLAELAMEEEQERQQSKRVKSSCNSRTTVDTARSNTRKSMAARPRQTLAKGSTLSSAIAVSDSSLSSINGASDSSCEGGGTSQSSFSLVIPSSDESGFSTRKTSNAAAKSKAKQNKQVTRRIAASSDDEEDAAQGSDDESEQDPALKLAAQVADLAVSDEDEATQTDDHLSDLLASVSQTKLEAFSAVIQRLRFKTSSAKSTPSRRLEKIGEASYSEVFKIFPSSRSTLATQSEQQEAIVLKIIPISQPTSSNSSGDQDDDLPYTSPAADVEREIRLMQLVAHESSASASFVSLQAAYIVRGTYPAPLLQAWDRWDAKRRAKTGEGAENIRPHVLGRQQVYALLVMSDGGVDLESLKVKSWLQAASIFKQVMEGLSEMENKYDFEHRDLHWGNILVKSVEPLNAAVDKATSWLTDPAVSGIKATIIDFTLSRACPSTITSKSRTKNPQVLYYPFDDETLFEGSGDAQFDVYREMQTLTRGEWQTYCPATNVLWLRYLVHKLIDVKCRSHKIPKPSQGKGDVKAQREWRAYTWLQKAAVGLDSAAEKLLDEDGGARRSGVGGRRSMHPRARKSVLPTSVAGRVRKGRATTAVTPLVEKGEEHEVFVKSAAELKSFLDR
ncbi:uncharacterized protein SPSC_02079 [Sporisorium scitamineum]|uniref:non-specific serine/threonine protein kinase n=1 Tax=Sporisorium scitamineum TaxID=49012 RepID=A0A0F7RVS8_9BASI|nr:hypothetical protein [Sporisorium scitamineum]CDU23450.1 uncharacterized protein SPSC_02079 [Sporisorium scitamineum]